VPGPLPLAGPWPHAAWAGWSRALLGHRCVALGHALRVPARWEASPLDQADLVAGPVDGPGL